MAEISIIDGRHTIRPQRIGRVFGWFFLATIVTSVPAYFVGYHQMLTNPGLITGAGANPARGIETAAMLEVLLIISNVATAVVAYPALKRESEMGGDRLRGGPSRRGHVHRDRDRQRPHVRADATRSHGRF